MWMMILNSLDFTDECQWWICKFSSEDQDSMVHWESLNTHFLKAWWHPWNFQHLFFLYLLFDKGVKRKKLQSNPWCSLNYRATKANGLLCMVRFYSLLKGQSSYFHSIHLIHLLITYIENFWGIPTMEGPTTLRSKLQFTKRSALTCTVIVHLRS